MRLIVTTLVEMSPDERAKKHHTVDPEVEWRRVVRLRLDACNIVYGHWRGLPPSLIVTDPIIDHGYVGAKEPPKRERRL